MGVEKHQPQHGSHDAADDDQRNGGVGQSDERWAC